MDPVSREVFLAQCKRRFGTANPERVRLEHWEWMARTRVGAWKARQLCGADPWAPLNTKPWRAEWCFDRFGISRTRMPDGRLICIGGEHEDGYDPDFCIYNDVVVLRAPPGKENSEPPMEGEVEIYAYPETVFPPTDFHTATLVGDEIYVIGSLGYQHARGSERCPVHVLDTRDYRMSGPKTRGSGPGWMFRHHASYDASKHAITVRGGNRMTGEDSIVNHRVHRLHLDGLRWELVREHEPHGRYLFRCDGERYPDTDIWSYRPPLPHTELDITWKDFATWRIDVHGVRVEMNDCGDNIRLLIEGEPGDGGEGVRERIVGDIQRHLLDTSGRWWRVTEVDSFE